MADTIRTKIEQGTLSPTRFYTPDMQAKVKAVFGEEPGEEFLRRMGVEADLRKTGARWNPNVNSVTGTVLEGTPNPIADGSIRAGTNLLRGRVTEAGLNVVNMMRGSGYNQQQLDAIGDLLLADPKQTVGKLFPRAAKAPPSAGGAVNAFEAAGGPISHTRPAQEVANAFQEGDPLKASGFGGGAKPDGPIPDIDGPVTQGGGRQFGAEDARGWQTPGLDKSQVLMDLREGTSKSDVISRQKRDEQVALLRLPDGKIYSFDGSKYSHADVVNALGLDPDTVLRSGYNRYLDVYPQDYDSVQWYNSRGRVVEGQKPVDTLTYRHFKMVLERDGVPPEKINQEVKKRVEAEGFKWPESNIIHGPQGTVDLSQEFRSTGLAGAPSIGATPANAFVGGGVGAAAPAETNEERVRNAFIGAGGMAAASKAPAVMNAFKSPQVRAQAGGLAEKGLVVGAAAAGSAPEANPQGADFAGELDAVSQQIAEIETNSIPALEEDLRLLESPDADPRMIQDTLQRRGFDLGPAGIDGNIGPATRQAIAENIAQIRADREALRANIESLQERRNDLEIRAVSANQQSGNAFIEKGLPAAATVAGILGAYKLRGRGVAKSQQAARAIEDKANAFVTRLPPPPGQPDKPLRRFLPGQEGLRNQVAEEAAEADKLAKQFEDRLAGRGGAGFTRSGINSPDTRAANVNEFWRLGGAGEDVPFEPKAKGGWKPRKDPADLSTLYRPQGTVGRAMEPLTSRVRVGDVAAVATGAADAALMEPLLQSARKDIEEAKADLARYEAARDATGIERAQERLQQAKTMETVFLTAQRMGIGLAAGGGLATMKGGGYATPRPNLAGAERERALVAGQVK
ncbi:MAG: hypothetical protein AAGK02_09685 [Pseudomonadota bacterium]